MNCMHLQLFMVHLLDGGSFLMLMVTVYGKAGLETLLLTTANDMVNGGKLITGHQSFSNGAPDDNFCEIVCQLFRMY